MSKQTPSLKDTMNDFFNPDTSIEACAEDIEKAKSELAAVDAFFCARENALISLMDAKRLGVDKYVVLSGYAGGQNGFTEIPIYSKNEREYQSLVELANSTPEAWQNKLSDIMEGLNR